MAVSATASTSTSTIIPASRSSSSIPPAFLANFPPPPPIPKSPSRSLRRPSTATSTPNLKLAYSAHTGTSSSQQQHFPPPPRPPSAASASYRPAPLNLSRKTSLAVIKNGSVARDSDASEVYIGDPFVGDSTRNMAPATPGRLAAPGSGGQVAVGDIVDVPGNMQGVVRFVGSVQGKAGVFAGVELSEEYAARGKNNGDVDGVSYFSTDIPGAGIFLPIAKAARQESGRRPSFGSVPPKTPTPGLRNASQNSTNFTPPTPGVPKLFSASVGPGARAPSPQGKRPRASLPRPESPLRRQQATPGPRPSIGAPVKTPSRYGSPTNRQFAQSVRGTAGDPAKRGARTEPKHSTGPRSVSAMGSASGMEDETTPIGRPPMNGGYGSVSSFNGKLMRPPSRNNSAINAANEEELERLRAQLEERDRQFKEQAANLSEMEQSLTELQSLMESSEAMGGGSGELDDKDTAQLKAVIREKNEKIAMLTSEFDAHRADFRSTIDTLEMASTETERVYEKRIEELIGDLRELESRNVDVDSVAIQLKQLEELVMELEEGLEDARRGEAEARGEVEFLRGEVERTRTELRREREKAGPPGQRQSGGNDAAKFKELEKKEDEIRGLKAIIHSLSRDPVPNQEERTPTQNRASFMMNNDHVENKIARDNLERQVAELQSILENKSSREAELEQELEALRNNNSGSNNGNNNAVNNYPNGDNQRDSANINRSSLRDSRDTVVLSRDAQVRSPDMPSSRGHHHHQQHHHKHQRSVPKLDTMPESDTYSTATENSTLWCEICEANGHDILTCTNMFGSEAAGNSGPTKGHSRFNSRGSNGGAANGNDAMKADDIAAAAAAPAPLTSVKSKTSSNPIRVMPNPMESGPVAGKESGVMDPEKWCAVCERDGHDSVDCPFEDAF